MTSEEQIQQRPHFRVLGPLSVELANQPLALGGRLRRALLADLALHPNQVLPMDRLVEDLWGDAPPDDPVNTVQVYVGQLRRVLEPGRGPREPAHVLVSTPPGYQLVVAGTELDALAFEALLSAGRAALALHAMDRAASSLHEALALWRGPALPEFADAAFARGELARLEELRLQALEDRIEADLALGKHRSVVTELQVLTAQCPLRERLWGLRLLALYRCNRQAEALRAFLQARSLLGDELGIEPGAPLQRLHRRILSQDRGLDWTPAPPRRVPTRRDRPPADDFVGRQAELAALERALEHVLAGDGAVALVAGEAGMGKTRLVTELATRAWARGATVAFGRCFEGDSAAPFAPVLECLADLARASDPSTLRQAEHAAAVVARLLPDLHDILEDLPVPEPLPPEEERTRLFDAVARLVVTASRAVPALLVVDDLQWADAGTLALTGYLVRATSADPLLIVGCYRPSEVPPGSALERGLAALQRERPGMRLDLAPLTEDEAAELVRNVLGRGADPVAVARLVARARGHPFFLGELASDAREGVLDIDKVPAAARELVLRRLHRLSQPCQRLAAAASVFDGPFDVGVVAAASGMGDEIVLDALDQLMLGGLIVPAGDEDSCEFVHDIARQVIYETLTSSRRLRLHRAVAAAMEQHWPEERQRHAAAALAHHYASSAMLGGGERGAVHAERAAAAAEAAHASDDAVRLLQLALDLLPPDDNRAPRLLARLGQARIATGAEETGVAAFRHAVARIADAEGGEVAAALLAGAAEFAAWSGAWTAAAELATMGLGYAQDEMSALWARLKTVDLLANGIADPEWPGIILGTGDQLRLSHTLRCLAAADLPRGSVLFIAFASRADVLATTAAEPEALTYWAGEYARALTLLTALASQAEDAGALESAIVHRATEARCLNALGRFAEADAAFERGALLIPRLATPSVFAIHLLSADEERWAALGDGWGRYRVHLRDVVDQRWLRWYSVGIGVAKARVMANSGAGSDAIARLEALLPAIGAAPPWTENYPRILHAAAEVHWLAGRADHAALFERLAREKLLGPDFRYPMTDLRLTLARLVAVQGRLDEAAEWFEQARDVLDEQQARPLRAIVDHDEGVVEARLGHVRRAHELFATALQRALDLGMSGWARKAAAAAAALPRSQRP